MAKIIPYYRGLAGKHISNINPEFIGTHWTTDFHVAKSFMFNTNMKVPINHMGGTILEGYAYPRHIINEHNLEKLKDKNLLPRFFDDSGIGTSEKEHSFMTGTPIYITGFHHFPKASENKRNGREFDYSEKHTFDEPIQLINGPTDPLWQGRNNNLHLIASGVCRKCAQLRKIDGECACPDNSQ